MWGVRVRILSGSQLSLLVTIPRLIYSSDYRTTAGIGQAMADFDFDQFKREFMDGMNNAAGAVTSAAKETSGDFVRFKHFCEIGRDISIRGLVTSHGGNLSECDGSSIWISRSGVMLGHMATNDIVRTFMSPTDLDQKASRELVVHRAMYQAWASRMAGMKQDFGYRAIVHTHSLYTVLRSLVDDSIKPIDSEGKLVLGESVPVFNPSVTIASEEVAELMADFISSGASVGVIRGHGPFAMADTLENAYQLISCLEYSSELLTHYERVTHPVL